jgi:hypothetical protein
LLALDNTFRSSCLKLAAPASASLSGLSSQLPSPCRAESLCVAAGSVRTKTSASRWSPVLHDMARHGRTMLWPIASYLLGRSHPRLLTIPGRALDWSHPLLTQRTACFDQVRALEMVSNDPASSSQLSAFTVCTTATTCQINSSTCLRL